MEQTTASQSEGKPKRKSRSSETTAVAGTERPALSKAEKRALFDSYSKADAAWEKAKAHVEELAAQRSNAVKAIHEALGSGPFLYQGEQLRLVVRGDTYFFRGRTDKNQVEEI